MLSRRFQFSAMGCVLLAALSSATPAHAMPVAIPLALTAETVTMTCEFIQRVSV